MKTEQIIQSIQSTEAIMNKISINLELTAKENSEFNDIRQKK
jgi:hypothetical protein